MRLEIDSDTIWKGLRIFSMRCIWNFPETQFGIILECFRRGAIGNWLRHNLELSWNIFDEMQLEFD